MDFDLGALARTVSIYAVPVLLAITLHEAAHGFVARHFGDDTAHAQGRISLNPLRHVDPFGTVLVPLVFLVLSKLAGGSGMLFGWAKPVPVNFNALRHPKRDMLWVAAAGPAANLFMACAWTAVIRLTPADTSSFFALPLVLMAAAGVLVNAIFLVLNLLPLPPLDGGRIAVSLLPRGLAYRFARLEPYGFIVLIALLVTGALGQLIGPVIAAAVTGIADVFGLPPGTIVDLLDRI